MVRVRRGGDGADVCAFAKAKGEDGRSGGNLCGHGGPGRVVRIAHGGGALAEQGGFAGAVFVEVGVLRAADVVRGQVQKQSRGEGEAVDPLQLHGLGGDLHHHMRAPGAGHLAERLVQGDGLRGGVEAAGQLLAADVRTQGADHTGLVPRGGEDIPEHMGGGGFALGAGNGNEGEGLLRVAVKFCRKEGQRGPRVLHRRAGHVLRQGRAAHHGGGAPPQGLGDVGAAVGIGALHGHKQRAGGRFPGIAGEGGDFRLLGTGRSNGV